MTTAWIYRGFNGDERPGSRPVYIVRQGGLFTALPQIVYHSPDGFNWGYTGSGPADLALSILAHAIGERQTPEQAAVFDPDGCPRAMRLHQEFKREFIAPLATEPGTSWEIGGEKVLAWINAQEGKLGQLTGSIRLPHVTVDLSDPTNDGNAHAILSRVRQAMRRAGVDADIIGTFEKEAKSGDYDHLIQVVMEWVNVD